MTAVPSATVTRREPELPGQTVVVIGGSAGIANGAREPCAAPRTMKSAALCSSRGLRFDVAALDDRQDTWWTRMGRTRS